MDFPNNDTMQVSLWAANDYSVYEFAKDLADAGETEALRRYLTNNATKSSAGRRITGYLTDKVNWDRVAEELVGD